MEVDQFVHHVVMVKKHDEIQTTFNYCQMGMFYNSFKSCIFHTYVEKVGLKHWFAILLATTKIIYLASVVSSNSNLPKSVKIFGVLLFFLCSLKNAPKDKLLSKIA